MSEEHKLFIKRSKKFDLSVRLTQISTILIFIFLWQFLADNNIVNSFITSSPYNVIKTIINLFNDGTLFINIWITLYETIISFLLGTFIGLVVASILWSNKFIAKVIDPFLTILNSLPKVALGPIIIIWAGAGVNSIIIMALLISTIITIINIYQGFIDIDPVKIKLMKSLKASKTQTYFKLILPGSFNIIISTLKINISMSLIGIIMGEFLVSKQGIGYLIMYGSQVFNLNLVITGIVILGFVSIVMYYLISYLESKMTKSR
jgi:NitT/TauT family transport system permease protein